LATAQKQHSCFVKQNQEHSTETDYAKLQVGEYFYKEMMKIKKDETYRTQSHAHKTYLG
jgi:hypothetical protein